MSQFRSRLVIPSLNSSSYNGHTSGQWREGVVEQQVFNSCCLCCRVPESLWLRLRRNWNGGEALCSDKLGLL